jgi:hypothetical protein
MTLVNWHNKLTASDDADDGRRKNIILRKWSGRWVWASVWHNRREGEFSRVRSRESQMPNNQLNVKAVNRSRPVFGFYAERLFRPF